MANKKTKILEHYRLEPELSIWLTRQSKKTGKTKTRLLEEALRAKMILKEAA